MKTLTPRQIHLITMLVDNEVELWLGHIDIPEKYIKELNEIKDIVREDKIQSILAENKGD